jgi:hypothetical protein
MPEERHSFVRPNAGIVGLNYVRCVNVYLRFVVVLSRVGIGLADGLIALPKSPTKEPYQLSVGFIIS